MSIIYCGKSNRNPFYIKEADINIFSIQELSYFIYNYAMLISNTFISKSLIIYIDKVLGLTEFSNELNEMFNKKISLPEMLTFILKNSNYYTDEEINTFNKKLIKLINMNEIDYINLAGDKLFFLKKYEKAITQYSKISKKDNYALLKLGYSYAKLQFYENAVIYLGELYKKTSSIDVLKDIYFCLKLSGNTDKIYDYEQNIKEEILADWEFNIVSTIIKVRKSDEIKEKEDIFLMGSNHIKQTVDSLIKIWKEKYRYIG